MPALRPPSSVLRSPSSGLVLPGGRPAAQVAFETEMVDFFVAAAELLGVPKSVAAIYGVVFASPEPLSFADIAGRLDLSKGSVSQGLRVLREVGAVKEVSTPADPAELFIPDLEMRQLIGRYISSRLERQLQEGRGHLGGLEQRLSALPHDQQDRLEERLQKLQQWHKRMSALLPVVRTFLKIT